MPMHRIDLKEIKPGYQFSKSVFDSDLNIVLKANEVVSPMKLNEMKAAGYSKLETAGQMLDENRQSVVNENESGSQDKFDGMEMPVPDVSLAGLEQKDSVPALGETPPVQQVSISSEKQTISLDKDTARYVPFYKEMLSNLSSIYRTFRITKTLDTALLKKYSSKIVDKVYKEKKAESLLNLVHLAGQEDYMASHILNSSILALLLGKKLNFSFISLSNLSTACLVFDIGMLRIPSDILEKKTPLTKSEFNQIKTHPILGYQIIRKEFNLNVGIARVALEHHERYDGSGYPRRISGKEISDMSRIIAIVDTYEAMTRQRHYKEKKESFEAMKAVLGEGSSKMDPHMMKIFLGMMSIYPVGSYVKLNTGDTAMVISPDPVSPFRPIVKIIRDNLGNLVSVPEEEEERRRVKLHLAKEKAVYIVSGIKSDEFEKKLE